MIGFTGDLSNGITGSNQQDRTRSQKRRVPSMSETLQYAPFTSVVPFDSDLIPVPNAVSASYSVQVLQPEEERSVRHTTDVLDQEARVPRSTSMLLGQTLGDVRHLLNEVEVPDYKFKVPSVPVPVSHPYTPTHLQHRTNGSAPFTLPYTHLKPFASMVLSTTDIPFRYPTPESRERSETRNGYVPQQARKITPTTPSLPAISGLGVNGHIPNHQLPPYQPSYCQSPHYSTPTQLAAQRAPPPLMVRSQNAQDFQRQRFERQSGPDPNPVYTTAQRMQPVVVVPQSPQDGQIYQSHASVASQSPANQPVTPRAISLTVTQHQQVPTTNLQNVGPAVFVPQFPSSSDQSQYQQHPDIDAQIMSNQQRLPQKRKRDAEDAHLEIDRRAQANASVETLQNLLANIFEAEDQLEPDTSGSRSDVARNHFVPASLQDGRQPALTTTMLTSIEETVAKVIAIRRFADVPVEQVAHLQRLCLSSIGLANGLELAAPEDASDTAIEDYIERTHLADNGLRASKLLLRIMTAGRDEKQLYSEDLLQELLANLQNVLENCVMPMVEKRASSSEGEIFKEKPECQTSVLGLMQRAGRVIKLLGDLVLTTEVSETSITTVEFLTTKLLFLENASTDKDSLLGIQKVELLRRHAMDAVAKIFLQRPAQRQFIFDEVLSSLEKLPVTRQSARHFKIASVKPIQLVSALIMQLVQTSTMSTGSAKTEGVKDEESGEMTSSEYASDESSLQPKPRKRKSENKPKSSDDGPLTTLRNISKPLLESAQTNAAYVMRFLVQRAMTSTKSGDQPYRNLLDIFTEDFLNVVALPAWPAAEVLLRALLSQLFGIINNAKAAAPAKNMALDLMGSIGSTIADIRSHVNHALETADNTSDFHVHDLPRLCQDALEGNTLDASFFDAKGPYRLVLDHVGERRTSDLQSRSASCFHVTNWAQRLIHFESPSEDAILPDGPLRSTISWLTNALTNHDEAFSDLGLVITESTTRLCYALTLLTLPLFKAFTSLLNTLLSCLTSPQATLRSRSLKSVIQLLEKDPSILDISQTVIAKIIQCTQDTSPLVRDSALTLVGKCTTLRPALGPRACKAFIERSVDASTGVRKRAVKLLGEAYLRERSLEVKAAIADAILTRLNDNEETIADLARQTIEDIWLAPFRPSSGSEDVPLNISKDLEQHTALIVATAKRGDEVMIVLETLLRTSLRSSTKASASNRVVCKAMVNVLFDCIIDNDQTQGRPSQKDCLRALTIYAKAEPQLFIADQMTTLLPYIRNLTTNEDLMMYRWVVIIYRRVLPALPPLQRNFLLEVQDVLFKTVQKLTKNELGEVAMCLWIVNGVLQNTEKLVKLTISVLRGIEAMKTKDLWNNQEALRISKYLMLAGNFGKACDFETQDFKPAFPFATYDSVSGLIIDLLLPLAGRQVPITVRENALEAISLICQSWPRGYQLSSSVLQAAFDEPHPDLQRVILSGVRAFYIEEEARSKGELEPLEDAKDSKERLGQSMVLSDKDSASTGIAQQFLPHILRIALARLDDLAITATDIITSINRQGLVHPKEIIAALVALETSPMPLIAKIALEEHRDVHAKHESMLDKEYLNAIEQAFVYQATTVGSVSGVTADNHPKLGVFFDVLKTGSITGRKKFFVGLCTRLEDFAKPSNGGSAKGRLPFARFVLENVGLFEYSRTDELLQLIVGLEKAVNTTGSMISQQIEPLLGQFVQASTGDDNTTYRQMFISPDLSRLSQLTGSAMILSMLWETRTYLRRAWGLQTNRNPQGKVGVKDGSKLPTRSSNASSEDFLAKVSLIGAALEEEKTMLDQCHAFLELMNLDAEHKVSSDEDMVDESGNIRLMTPSDNGTDGSGSRGSIGPPSSNGARRKRSSLSAASTPQKAGKAKRPSAGNRRRSSKANIDDDENGGWD